MFSLSRGEGYREKHGEDEYKKRNVIQPDDLKTKPVAVENLKKGHKGRKKKPCGAEDVFHNLYKPEKGM
ncbi:hypothetical protein MASR2M17_10370 [Aminivibrio sp.]